MRKRLHEQVPNKFVDEEETPAPQAEPEKPKSSSLFFGKHKDRISIEIPVDRLQTEFSHTKLKEISTIHVKIIRSDKVEVLDFMIELKLQMICYARGRID